MPVVVINDSPLFRAGLVHILAGSRFRVKAACSAPEDLSETVFNAEACLVLISLDNGVELRLTQVLALSQRGIRVIVLAQQFRSEELLAAIEAGADGYLLSNGISPDALLKSLELVWLGGMVMPQEALKLYKAARSGAISGDTDLSDPSIVEPLRPNITTQNVGAEQLSNREETILKQLTHGASNKHIARDLSIAEATVKVHVKSLLRKIRVRNRTQAAMWAIERSARADQ